VKQQEFLPENGAKFTCAQLGPTSSRVMISGDDQGVVSLWKVNHEDSLMSLSNATNEITSVSFAKNEEQAFGGTYGGTAMAWDLESQKCFATLKGHRSACITFAPFPSADQPILATGSTDTNVKIWDLRKKGCIATYKGHSLPVTVAEFSPDWQWIVTGGADGSVKIWELKTGKVLKEFSIDSTPISTLDFNPKHCGLAVGGHDRIVRYWDLQNFELAGQTQLDSTKIQQVKFASNGVNLFSASNDSLKVWDMDRSKLVDSIETSWKNVTSLEISPNEEELIGLTQNSTYLSVWSTQMNSVSFDGKVSESIDLEDSRTSMKNIRRTTTGSFMDDSKNTRSSIQKTDQRKGFSKYDPKGSVPTSGGAVTTGGGGGGFYGVGMAHSPKTKKTDDIIDSFDNLSLGRSRSSTDNPLGSRAVTKSKIRTTNPANDLIVQGATPGMRKSPDKRQQSPIKEEIKTSTPYDPFANSNVVSKPLQDTSSKVTVSSGVDAFGSYDVGSHQEAKVQATTENNDKPRSALNDATMIPSKGGNINLDEFVKNTPVDDSAVLDELMSQHTTLVNVIQKRSNHVKIILNWWAQGNIPSAINALNMINDQSTTKDVLGHSIVGNKLEGVINFDQVTLILPHALTLIESKYEPYLTCGLKVVESLFDEFGNSISSMKTVPLNRGVDLAREERLRKADGVLEKFREISQSIGLQKACKRDNYPEISSLAKRLSAELEFFIEKCDKSVF